MHKNSIFPGRGIQSLSFGFFFIIGAVNYILRCQCDANARNKQGFTPLHLAASVGSIHVCQCLMEGGANINCVNTQYRVRLVY